MEDNNTSTKKYSGPIGVILDTLGRVIEWVDKYGLIKMIKALFFCVATAVCVLFMSETFQKRIAEAARNSNDTTHAIGTELRSEVSTKINGKLLKMAINMGADRAFVFEMHNGKENPTNLPFNYCDMTYEEVNDAEKKVCFISDNFENINMGRFNFPYYIDEHNYFIGTIEEFCEMDKKMGYRLMDENITYVAMILIKTHKEIGFLGVTFSSEPSMTKDEIHGKLGTYVQEIACLLDYTKQREIYDRRKHK